MSAQGHEAGRQAGPTRRADAAHADDGSDRARAFVGLGSNEGDRLAHLRRAVASIDAGALPGCAKGCVVAVSAVYETRPVGPDPALAGGPYLNAALEVRLHAEVSAEAIVEALLRLEAEHGRVRRARWAPRALDLDLLLLLDTGARGELVARRVTTERVTLPHPRMLLRDFVLAPLSELVPSEPVLEDRSAAHHLAALPAPARTILRRLDVALRS